MNKYALAITIAGLIASSPAPALAQWSVKSGAIVCASYFAMKDGEAAASNARWLSETGCHVGNDEAVRAVIDGNRGDPSGILRTRIASPTGDETVYIRAHNIITRLPNGRWKTLPCEHGGGWRCEKAFQ